MRNENTTVTTVIAYVDVKGISHVAEKEKAFTMKANLTMVWNDTRLQVFNFDIKNNYSYRNRN